MPADMRNDTRAAAVQAIFNASKLLLISCHKVFERAIQAALSLVAQQASTNRKAQSAGHMYTTVYCINAMNQAIPSLKDDALDKFPFVCVIDCTLFERAHVCLPP